MAINENLPQDQDPQDEAKQATPEAQALHGDKARVEQREQPEVTKLDGDTRIATDPAPER